MKSFRLQKAIQSKTKGVDKRKERSENKPEDRRRINFTLK